MKWGKTTLKREEEFYLSQGGTKTISIISEGLPSSGERRLLGRPGTEGCLGGVWFVRAE